MSADRQRLKKAIRDIALTPEERRQLLGEGQNKGGKAGAAGVGVSDAERDRICCDGSTSGNANPGTDEREPGERQTGLDSSDPADIGGGDGTLSGVTDCATGEPICFDGAGFIPPDGWGEPDEPPVPDDWVADSGVFWHAENIAGSVIDWPEPRPETEYTRTKGQMLARFESVKRGNDDIIVFDTYIILAHPDIGENTRAVIVNCPSDRPLANTYCGTDYGNPTDEEIPYPDAWPSDGCTNLIVKDGKIVGSKWDPDQDGSYSAPRDSIDLCSSGDQISLAPSADGGWKTINSTNDNGYLYNSKGEQIAHIDGNEYSDQSV